MLGPENSKKVKSWYVLATEKHFVEAIESSPNGTYQEKHRKHALGFVKKFRNAIDGGSCYGFWTRDMCRVFDKVYAFEPVADHRNCFDWNMRETGDDNYELYPYCIGEKERWVSLINDPSATGNVSIDPLKSDGEYEMRTIDSFGFQDIDFIKLDLEGHEYEALVGAKKTILKCKPVINIEIKHHAKNFGHKEDIAADYLKSLGMTLLGKCISEHVFGWSK